MLGGLDGPRQPPANGGKPKQLVIFAHGYGSNGEDLIGMAPFFSKVLPDAVFVSPNAPEPVPGYQGGYQWFPLAQLDPQATSAGARAAAPHLDRYIDAQLKRYDLPASACALIGFSQGTMMALQVGLRRKERLAAILGFSGMLAGPDLLPREIASRPPIALIHGDRDEVIPIQAMFMGLQALAAASTPCRWRIMRGAGHTITEDGLSLGVSFLKDAFSGRLEGWAAPVAKPQGV